MEFSQFEAKIGLTFNDKQLLRQAFTHRSYLNEHKEVKTEHNERLEFLGDAVLELIATEFLFSKFPKSNEGDLTAYRAALVNTVTLSETAAELEMNDYLLLSKGEAKDTGRARQSILADTFEAVTGALFIDQGYDAAKKFIGTCLLHKIDSIIEEGKFIDNKSLFQERAQDKVSITPAYRIVSESGPDHDKKFEVGVYLGEELIAHGKGSSKQEAEQNAAREALKKQEWL